MNNKVYIIGVGPGNKELIHSAAMKIISNSDVLIGGRRNLELFRELQKERVVVGNNLDEISTFINKNASSRKIAVLVTGDTGIYSIMEYLNTNLKDIEFEAIPGISSLQYLCSKLRLSWNDMYISSVHGREQRDLINIIKTNNKVALFAGGSNTPDVVCKRLIEGGLKGLNVSVGGNLSYPNERIIKGKLEELADIHFESLSIMIIIKENDEADEFLNEWGYITHGIPDDRFIRGEVPMTKEEIRAIAVSKLRLEKDSIVYDIGAGTGSVSIECAIRSTNGTVYAIDKNEAAVTLLYENIKKFGAANIKAIQGKAPDALQGLPEPDRVFIGGSCGNMESILDFVMKISKKLRVVINAVTIESTYEAIESLENKGFMDIEIVNASISRGRKVGGKHLMQAINPVYIISAEKR